MDEGITLLNVNKKITVGKPVVAGAAGILGLILLSKYLQSSKENRILSTLQQQSKDTNALLQRGLAGTKSDAPRISNYPEY